MQLYLLFGYKIPTLFGKLCRKLLKTVLRAYFFGHILFSADAFSFWQMLKHIFLVLSSENGRFGRPPKPSALPPRPKVSQTLQESEILQAVLRNYPHPLRKAHDKYFYKCSNQGDGGLVVSAYKFQKPCFFGTGNFFLPSLPFSELGRPAENRR